MLEKRTTPDPGMVQVVFSLPAAVEGTSACVVGEWNQWVPGIDELTRTETGAWQTSIELPAGRSYRFRYLIDDERYENDWQADDYVLNDFGGHDSVVDLGLGPAGE